MAPQASVQLRVGLLLEALELALKYSREAREGCVRGLLAFQHVFTVTNNLALGWEKLQLLRGAGAGPGWPGLPWLHPVVVALTFNLQPALDGHS